MKKAILLLCVFIWAIGLANAQWAAKASYPGAGRYWAVGFSIGNKGYVGTGTSDALAKQNDFWEWDQATNTWTQKANFAGGARSGAVGFSIGTKGYIATGDADSGEKSDFWEYDPATNTWTQKADFPGGNDSHGVAFSIGTKGYIYKSNSAQFWEWDQATNTWTAKANFPGYAREYATGFSIGNKGYIGTGEYLSNSLNDFWEWNQDSNSWKQKASLSVIRDETTGFSIGNTGFIGTGHDNSSGYSYRTFYQWNQSTNTWSSVSITGFGTAEGECVSFSIGSKGYTGLGYNDNGDGLNTFYEYNGYVGIDENSAVQQFVIYPNPASDLLTVESLSSTTETIISIYNMQGQLILQQPMQQAKTDINISGLEKGVYMINILGADINVVKKLIKE